MMHRWGHLCVSSALEVYIVLSHPPSGRGPYAAWEDLLGIEPPTWGSEDAQRAALNLQARGFRVWTWDDYAVVFSRPETIPPRGVLYRTWRALAPHEES